MLAAGGFGVYDNFLDASIREQLLSEALTLYPEATYQENWEDDYAEGRGGKPRRRLTSASGGPVQDALYRSALVTANAHRRLRRDNLCPAAIAAATAITQGPAIFSICISMSIAATSP